MSSVHDLNRIKFQNVIGFVKSFYVARAIDVVGRPIRKSILSLAKVFRVHCRSRPGLPILAIKQVPKAAHNDVENVRAKYLNSKTNILQ